MLQDIHVFILKPQSGTSQAFLSNKYQHYKPGFELSAAYQLYTVVNFSSSVANYSTFHDRRAC